MKKLVVIIVVLIVIGVAVWYFAGRKFGSTTPAPEVIPRNDTVAGSSQPKQMEDGTVL